MAAHAVIFDLDGTLLNTLDDLADSCNAVLEAHGLPAHPAEAYRMFVGNGIEVLIRRALPSEHTTDELVAQCVAEMRQEYALRRMNKTGPYEGIVDLLHMTAIVYTDDLGTRSDETEIPANLKAQADEYRARLVESAAELDDHLTEKFLEGKPLDDEVIAEACRLVQTEATPITDLRSHEEYRRAMCGELLRRILQTWRG